MIDAMTCIAPVGAAPPRFVMAVLYRGRNFSPLEALSCQAIAVEEGQIEGILHAKQMLSQMDIKSEAVLRTDDSRTERTEGWRKFRRETDPLIPNRCSPMLHRESMRGGQPGPQI